MEQVSMSYSAIAIPLPCDCLLLTFHCTLRAAREHIHVLGFYKSPPSAPPPTPHFPHSPAVSIQSFNTFYKVKLLSEILVIFSWAPSHLKIYSGLFHSFFQCIELHFERLYRRYDSLQKLGYAKI